MRIVPLLLAGALFGAAASAGPLKTEQVAADAKWLLHLDVETALRTQLGAYLGEAVVEKQLGRGLTNLKKDHGIDLDWRKLQSLTAYGTDFQARADDQGVLLVRSTLDWPALLDQALARIAELTGGRPGTLKKQVEEGIAVYTLNREVHGASAKNGVFALSKSRAQLLRAVAVLEGRAERLDARATFKDFPPVPSSFFFLGLAEGFNRAGGLPPQARVFQSATSGRLAVGETDGQVSLNLILGTQDDEATTQIQQVLQGLLALAALSQPDNRDLQRLTQAVKFSAQNRQVSAKVTWPATNLIARIGEAGPKRKP